MSKETEERLSQYRTLIEDTITRWYEKDIDECDTIMRNNSGLKETNDDALYRFEKSRLQRKKIKEGIYECTNKIILDFANMLDHLEDSGVLLIPDEVLEEQIEFYLNRLGVKNKKLEGACLDADTSYTH